MPGKKGHRSFGHLRKLPSGRWQASYLGPDLRRHNGPSTYEAKIDGEAWLLEERRLIERGQWVAPADRAALAEVDRPVTFGEYADTWLADRELKPRTRAHYRRALEVHLLPAFGDRELGKITPAAVRAWHAGLDPSRRTTRAHAYGLLRTILGTAVQDGELPANPCHIRGAGAASRTKKIKPATLPELATIVEHLPERYRALALVSAWCALRFGEAAELRRSDVDLDRGLIHVRRAVVRVDGGVIVGTPKSAAGVRTVNVPPHLVPVLREHIAGMPMRGRDALLFPAADGVSHLNPSSLYRVFYPARAAAGRPDLRWHDLRHTGAVLAAQTGATLAELMARLGHSTPAAAMRYQHSSDDRDARLARELSRMAEGQTR
ncbi:MAG: site-specific integrase [Actinomycetales bacterium]|nr:site-specific integrase [Actinomycetales bacterium]